VSFFSSLFFVFIYLRLICLKSPQNSHEGIPNAKTNVGTRMQKRIRQEDCSKGNITKTSQSLKREKRLNFLCTKRRKNKD